MKKYSIVILILLGVLFVSLIGVTIKSFCAEKEGWNYKKGWYYLFSDGTYASSEYIDGYWIDASGWYDPAWDGKWKRDNAGWWFSSGAWYPTSQWLKIDGDWYYFKEDGYMAHGEWVEDYYLTESGAMATGDDVPDKISTRWTVTSYSSATGGQTMRYTIVDEFDRLIIIDGGWEEDAASLKEIIAEHDNHVYAWIVTHPHFDHAGAFNVIMSENNDIMVDDVYVTNLDYDRYKETAQLYDHFETCEKYKDVINGLDNVTVLKEGDVVECNDLTINVIHSWDDDVNNLKDHLCNNGSLGFIVKGQQEEMLFCGDIQSEVESYIIDRHADELSTVDYIQAGHHGNWGLTTDFYDCIEEPKVVFFDSNDDLLTPGKLKYDAGPLKDYFEKKGAQVVNFSSAPNSIILK